MQKKILQKFVNITLNLLLLHLIIYPQTQDYSLLNQKFYLGGKPTQEGQYFLMESKLISYTLDGKQNGTDIFRLRLKFVPAKISGKENDEYVCTQFSVQLQDSSEVTIPSLENWSYVFNNPENKELVFGIDHSKFENLIDSKGNKISFDKSYHVYNVFIDFHAFCNAFANRTEEGKGIQDLNKIGEKIIHGAAFSEPPTNLGNNIAEGSFFKNGEITLNFKGLSVVNNKQCALIEYDSGESSFKMIMKPVPNVEIQTIGSSHYFGDIYKDLETNWVQMVTMKEFVISETILPMPPNKINSIIERNIIIRNVSNDIFMKSN